MGRRRWKRRCRVMAAALAVAYRGVTGAAWVFLRYSRGLGNIPYVDLLLPQRWSRIPVALADRQIAQALLLYTERKHRDAQILVRAGLVRSPKNRDGRLLLARLLLESAQPEAARDVLLEGLPFHRDDPRYLHSLVGLLLRRQEDARVQSLARTLLATTPARPERDRLAALAAATASFYRGEFDQADDYLGAVPGLASSRDGRLLVTRADHARGYRELALLSLRALAAEFPRDSEIHTELVQRLRHANMVDEARRRSLSFQIAQPALARPRIELVRDLRSSGETARAAREIDALFRDFPADQDALLALGDFAANTGDSALARRLLAHARDAKQLWEPHALLVVESLISARDYRAALNAADASAADFPDFARRFEKVLGSLRGIALFGIGEIEQGRVLITHYLAHSYLRAENLLAIAQRLIDVDAPATARDALFRATRTDPLNQAALTRLVELDLNLNRIDELPAHLHRLIAMRQPSPDILRVARHKLGSDRFLFSAERPAALAAIHAVLERPPPRRAHATASPDPAITAPPPVR